MAKGSIPKGRPNIKTVAKPANRKGSSCYGPAVKKAK